MRSQSEVDAAIEAVRDAGLAPHEDAPRNWDYLIALGSVLESTSPGSRVLEMGAAPYSPLLMWLYQYGYQRLTGIDRAYRNPVRRGPIRYEPMELASTRFRDATFDAVACLPVTKHGVDFGAFLREARRLLRPGGVLVTSADFWCDPSGAAGPEADGQPARVLDRSSIEAFVATAESAGFEVRAPLDLACEERAVHGMRGAADRTSVAIVLHVPSGALSVGVRARIARAWLKTVLADRSRTRWLKRLRRITQLRRRVEPRARPMPPAPQASDAPADPTLIGLPATQPPGAIIAEASRALDALRVIGPPDREPILLGYHPVAHTNPYQALLYREAWGGGVAPLAILRDSGIDELATFATRGINVLLHLHWLAGVTKGSATEAEARQAGAAFLARLDELIAASGRIAWTVHNVLPHGTRFEAAETELREGVAARAAVVHVMARDTPTIVAPWFTIPPERLLHVPHPSYIGAYEDYVSREQARHDLELAPDELVYAAVGSIQPYKGLTELLDAWARLPDDRPRRLLIAGGPGHEPGVAELLGRAGRQPGVRLHARKIPASRMQVFLRAADVAVLPYLQSLNSGALMLALTFGLPVIVPAGTGLAATVDERYARTFEANAPDGLADALRAAHELATPEARAAARAAAEALDPRDLSRQFVTGLRDMLDRPAGR